MAAEIFKTSIIKLLKHSDYKPVKFSQLAKSLNISERQIPRFKAAFEQLREAGYIIGDGRNLVKLAPLPNKVVGTFKANVKGFGFVISHAPSAEDLFIPPKATGGAMTGDIVEAKVVKRGHRLGKMRYSGQVVEILQRAENRFVGTLLKTADGWVVMPDGADFTEPIAVGDVSAKAAGKNDKVVVEIISYATQTSTAFGVIVEVLGKAGAYQTEIKSVMRRFHLRSDFDSACKAEAAAAGEKFLNADTRNRDDITGKVIITIDPEDSKDFDDAISLEKDEQGHWVLGIHIADVSFFVTTASALDKEAKQRGNSVYLPGKVLPMLPEVLSNGICSLQPGQKRFAKSVYITYDSQGNILTRSFANSLICSTKRLTYRQADRILKGHTKDAGPAVIELLKNMETLSMAIEQRRNQAGMLHLDLPETELVTDKSGRVIDAVPADASYPHTIIEMFMVEANEAVAGLLDRLNLAFIRRIHPEPNGLSMKRVSKLVRGFGLTLPRKPDRADLQRLLCAVEGRDFSLAVNLVVLRSFERAVYAPLQIGHFALASEKYCHFTSPIRRYADLLIHRVLQYYLEQKSAAPDDELVLFEQDLVEIGKHISFTEQQAQDAENDLKKTLVLHMLKDHIGEKIDCVITGLAAFGVFAQSKRYGIEGLITPDDLGPDKWQYFPEFQRLTGLNSQVSLQLGQAIKVRIASVNVIAGQLNLVPDEPLVKGRRKKNKSGKAQKTDKRRASKQRGRKKLK